LKAKILYPHRALILAEADGRENSDLKRYLIVGDLHIGFEERFAGSGVSLNSNSNKMLSELIEIIKENRITDLIVNGDVKSGVDRILKSEWDNVPRFFTGLSEICRVSVVPGNHDGGLSYLLPNSVEVLDVNGVFLSDTLILHGHTRPLEKYSSECRRIVMGHVHPIFQRRGSPLSGQPVWVMLRVHRKSLFRDSLSSESDPLVEVILMPSFNLDLVVAGYSAEAVKEERRVAPLVRELRMSTEAIITTLQGEILGDASILGAVL